MPLDVVEAGVAASMGPTSLDVGGCGSWDCTPTTATSFNGADISRCRRDRVAVVVAEQPAVASMGPTSLDVGGGRAARPSRSSCPSFNGADISRCRRVTDDSIVRLGHRLLQWGRHLSMSEGHACATFTGAQRFALQWGRHLSMSEGRSAGVTRTRTPNASMGPTSLDVGGVGRRRWLGWGETGFNGADISRCRREFLTPRSLADHVVLQWGRHLSMSEGGARSEARRDHGSFNGADISRCRRVASGGAGGSVIVSASMGPTSLDVGGLGFGPELVPPLGQASMGPTFLDVGGMLD